MNNFDSDFEFLIDKENKLSPDYVPANLIVLDDNENNFRNYKDATLKPMLRADIIPDLNKMFEDAKKKGYYFLVDSGYRSYNYQNVILENVKKEKGVDVAIKLVASPGASEHQSGLCFDIAYFYNGVYSDNVKDNDEEVNWLIDNSYKYGFILRYPKGKEDITGFSYEPWHYRYVGKELAKILHDDNITLDEYHKAKKVRKR